MDKPKINIERAIALPPPPPPADAFVCFFQPELAWFLKAFGCAMCVWQNLTHRKYRIVFAGTAIFHKSTVFQNEFNYLIGCVEFEAEVRSYTLVTFAFLSTPNSRHKFSFKIHTNCFAINQTAQYKLKKYCTLFIFSFGVVNIIGGSCVVSATVSSNRHSKYFIWFFPMSARTEWFEL